jgi:hypothetical protein
MLRIIWKVVIAIVSGIALGLIGMLIGALIGGNFATGFQFNDVRGYEATGQVGFIFGAVIGVLPSWLRMGKG